MSRRSLFHAAIVGCLCGLIQTTPITAGDHRSPEYFTGCGELVSLPYPHCSAFVADTGAMFLLFNLNGFDVGDRVFVEGVIDSGCPSHCYIACLVDNAVETCTTPPGDLNGDGAIDVLDLLILLSQWGECELTYNCPGDLNGDGVVDVFDVLILLGNWS